jgi:2-methylcitrate dehydratase PrpD
LPFAHENKLSTPGDMFVNTHYLAACAAYRIHPSQWQDSNTQRDPKIREFMRRVETAYDEIEFSEAKFKDPEAAPARVEVFSKKKTYEKTTMYNKGAPREGFRNTNEEIAEKFKKNMIGILPWDRRAEIARFVLELERLENVAEFMKGITLSRQDADNIGRQRSI